MKVHASGLTSRKVRILARDPSGGCHEFENLGHSSRICFLVSTMAAEWFVG